MAKFSPLALIPITLGLLILLIYQFAPFVNQPDLGSTTIPTLTESRSNNEFKLSTNGLLLIPIAGFIVLFLGLWNATNKQLNRATSALMVLAGIVMLEYFVLFWMDYVQDAGTYLGSMGVGFWALLALGIALILQVFIPKTKATKEFQLRRLAANQESAIILALVLLIVVVGLINPRFLATRNKRVHCSGCHWHDHGDHYWQY